MPLTERFAYDARRAALHRGASRHAIGFALSAGACVAAAPLVAMRVPAWGLPAAAACGVVLVLHAAWTMRAVARLSRGLTAVEMSAAGVVLSDAGGRTRFVPWAGVRHVDVTGGGAEMVVDGAPRRYVFGADWPQAAWLARRLVCYADAHGRTLCVDGVACGALSLAALRPAPSPAPDADAV
jgi:hypothetical protein